MPITRLINNTEPEIHGTSNTLVVLLHGMAHGHDLSDWHEALKEFLPNADLLIPRYASYVLSNVAPRRVADQLAQYIHEAVTNRSRRLDGGEYERIILIGYSAGGLIIRKTYLIAMGYGDDDELVGDTRPLQWAKKVERIILMAAINRGISDTRPETMNWLIYGLQRVGWVVIPRLGFGKFLSRLRQGTPFVANLRVQWIRLSQAPDIQLPPTIQLLGDLDDVVAEEDNVDVVADANFKYLKVRDTGHNSICNFKDPDTGPHRKERFRYALMTPIELLESDVIPNADEVGQSKNHIVFVMHGIRDMGLWTIRVRETVEAVAQQLGQTVEVITAGYGYFPMLRFLFLGARQKNVRWFMDKYTEAIARYPDAKVSFIGHSNGTYLLASALRRYHACKVNRVAFAGSVVPKDYPWDELVQHGRVQEIRNDIASADWVVGIFPGLFELLKIGDIGTAGHNGFQDDTPKKKSIPAYFKGGHGAAIQPKNHTSLAHFILTGEVKPEEKLLVAQQEAWAVLLAKLCWAIWLVIGAIAVGLGFLFIWLLSPFSISPLVAGLFYAGFVLLLLYTL
jgi:pimeloyl-ACP methyl ester carboxylesterase